MKRRPRRNHTPAFKAKVAIAAIKAIERIAQLPEPFDAHPNQISRSEYRSSKTGGVDVCGPGGGKAAQPVGSLILHCGA